MNRCERLARRVREAYERILNEQMRGLPLVNERLRVECLHFRQLENGRVVGVLITPWLMNLVLFPAEGENWEGLEIGHKRMHDFPSGRHAFLVNEIEGLGTFQARSLHSPMRKFFSQDHARTVARLAMEELMKPLDPETHLDEERLERFIEGGDMAGAGNRGERTATRAGSAREDDGATLLTRRDLLRGRTGRKNVEA